eukprot:g4393.t1
MGAYKTQYLAWNLSAEKMKEAISSFGEVIDALLDVNVTKTEHSKLGHYEWLVTLTAQSESLPLLQIWTPDDSQLQFAVHFIPAGALASAMKKEEAFLGSSGGDKPSRKRIVSPKVVRADHLLETDKVGNEDETKSPRAVVKGALEHGNYKLASKVVLQDMENNGVTPGQMRVFRTTLDKISSYPKRGDFHIDIKLTCSQHIIIGNAVPIEYVYTHKDQAGKPHDVLDCIGIFFLGPGDATLNNIEFKEKPKMVGKAYVPEGNAGVLTFQDVTSGLGTYEVRYLLKGSAVSIGEKKRFHATHPAVRVKSASRCTIDEHLEIPFEFEYQLGDISLDLLDDDHPPDWAGIYAIDAPVNDLFGHFDHKKPIAKITMEGVKGKYKFLHGYPKFPGKYQVRVISGRFPDVILGKSEAFIVDAVSVIPSKQDLTDSRDILFYLSAPPEGTELDRETFYNSIMPSLVHLCDERRVSFSVVDPHLISGFNLKPNQSISPHMVDTFIEQIVKCRPYGLYFLPLNYGEIPKMLSPSLIAEFPWLKHYDNKKPGSGLSLCEIELMVGLVVPQFQHDEIAANTVVCYQHIDYKPAFEPQSPHTSAAGTKLVLDGPASADAQFDLKERVTGTDAQFVKNYYQSKSLKVPLTRCFRKIINQQFSKKDIPSWLKLAIPRLTADDRVTLIRHYHELWNIKLDMPTGSDAPASEVARDSDSEVDGQQGLKIEETDEVEQTIDPDSYGSVRVVGNLVRNIIVHQNFDMASQIEQDAPDAGTKKPPASPTQREEKEALVVVDTLAAVEIMFKQHPCSRQVYTASNREASIRPFLLKGMPLQRCIIHPPVFEVLVTDEHWPNLLQFIEHLKLPVVKFVRLIRRSIEKFYNIGYIGRHAKDDLVYVYQKAAKPTRRGGTLNVTVADYRRDVAKQLVGIIRLLCHRKQFRAAEAASKCAICLNMGVLQLEDIPKGNLVDLEACEKSCFFMAYTHCYNDINAHFHNATKRHKAEVHEKHMKKKEKSLMNVFQMLEEKNVKTKAAKGIILRNKTHRSQIRRVRMKRRSHSACRLLGSKLARFPARAEKSKEAQCPYI